MKALKVERYMNDKTDLLEAIDNYDAYTPKQKELLKLFLSIEVNDVVSTTPRELAEMLNTSKATIYLNLALLIKDGYIKNITNEGRHYNTYKLYEPTFNNLLEVYKKKKDYLKNIKFST